MLLKQNYSELKKSGILDLRRSGYEGEGVTILILDDEGIKLPWFDDQIITLFNNHVGVAHNTFVAQVVREVLPQARIIMANFFGKNSMREEIYEWVKKHKHEIDVINISQSVSTYDFRKFEELEIPIVCASGNSGEDDGVDHPANLGSTIAVGAENEKTGIASYSNGGKELDCVGYTGMFVYRENKRKIQFQGTSCAAPFVCGMLGLMVEHLKKNGYQKPNGQLVKKFIYDYCIDMLEEGFDFKSGYGRFVLPDFDYVDFNKYFVRKDGNMSRTIKMDVPAQIINDRFCIPTRFIAEATGGKANWDEETKTGTFIIGNKVLKATHGSTELTVVEV